MPSTKAEHTKQSSDARKEQILQGDTKKEKVSEELVRYQDVLRSVQDISMHNGTDPPVPGLEELRTVPLIWWDVNEHIKLKQKVQRGYAVLGHIPTGKDNNSSSNISDDASKPEQTIRSPILLNTDTPWSAFLCGSQGSGKSHTLSCMLENCLLTDKQLVRKIGVNPNPLAGLVFHYDSCQGSGVCEAAYLCSKIPTTVLTILMILRDMAIETKGAGPFNYTHFKNRLFATTFAPAQSGPMDQRLKLLESLMPPADSHLPPPPRRKPRKSKAKPDDADADTHDYLTGTPGTLTIVDLTDPTIDADGACVLFNICLSVFIQQAASRGKIVALDEAHKYMTESSAAASTFTQTLLQTVREQRHQATRVVIATQEPSINTQLLDLCSLTMVHRCTSPAWFAVLKKHIGALYLGAWKGSEEDEGEHGDGGPAGNERALFQQIVRLKLGESLLFCPTAAVTMSGGAIGKMHAGYVKFKTRQRVTADGGRTRLAARDEE
ncbi:hypothetical protein K491DRAFT_584523 [Lophiostoma macrostomum CBS 122681]|uniref:AAA+ ATPase domain-containing protein n=1 Tax=Lophiostoma macrostomum CBS 122681 TaxID=1314788 RepID=A0A6A6TU16_9PLEO|nr:hypothetical protein K491DRAFT_584523 [Lophiostoma macrostomum CBS 122681]